GVQSTACTAPLNGTISRIALKDEGSVTFNLGVKGHGDLACINTYLSHRVTSNTSSRGNSSSCVISRPLPIGRIVFSHSSSGSCGQRQAFRHMRALSVILISRQRDGRQNPNDRHHDHQFNKGKTFLHLCFHFSTPFVVR